MFGEAVGAIVGTIVEDGEGVLGVSTTGGCKSAAEVVPKAIDLRTADKRCCKLFKGPDVDASLPSPIERFLAEEFCDEFAEVLGKICCIPLGWFMSPDGEVESG
jgi:hypothetical protein